ncbi:lipopolysaccharide biosynthesis protein [Glaciimonas sp. Gout2]|uniref:lipopolysaccharide biosynthesis protein n=1 Tax=unclassified Glaciimonas TaxID=2644401 RepID=UPI002B2241BA|nr:MULTISPECIES: lipopolysaccharide biosynthesis protein [unclassified Glaciimonas]MEB0011019.1 lipopolysaccharide biosynthesis protein [Glaciimonas sp. Cout2]MEB0084579.1 lipopolysaccharide biosynthesis protein [Glaciimonas sp. Gout2]
MEQINSHGNVISGSTWSIMDNLAQQVLSFAIFAVLARFLEPDAFGLLTVAHLFILFTRLVVFDAIAMPVVRAADPDDKLYSWVFTYCTVIGFLLACLMFCSAGVVSTLFGAPELKSVWQGMSISILFFGVVRAFEARLVRNMMFRQLAIRSIFSVTLGGIVGISLAVSGVGGMSLVGQQVTASGLALLLVMLQSRWLPRIVFDRALTQRFWIDSRQVSIAGFLDFVSTNGDALLVSVCLGPYATGLYNMAKRMTSSVYLLISSSMHKVALPVFSNSQSNAVALQLGYLKILGITLFCAAPLLCFQAELARPLIAVVFGQKWLPAAPTVGALAILYLIASILDLNDYLFFAIGKNRVPVVLGIAKLTLAGGLSAFFYRFGLLGMSLSFCAAHLILFPLSQTLISRAIGLNTRITLYALAPPVVGSIILWVGLACYVLAMSNRFNDVTLIVGGTLLASLLYPGMVAITGWRVRDVNGSWQEVLLLTLRIRRFFTR